ncbi:hypothetical protein FE257_000863 [Aspergillus nanangensis]|uniref:Uncharacterized protein n=1 Tax=Aspergillus nanangensis TaxID=2582783 RepID=A0AAD4GP85_ASPNN|nr:hypothetical protein FE257_000863 [Aspergillus nanangensis]
MDQTLKWKSKGGQTRLVMQIFREAESSGLLAYSLFTPVAAVDQTHQQVTITTNSGAKFTGLSNALGALCMFAPGFATRFQRALQAPQGIITFVSADWADGWHGFIDDAIEQGLRAGVKVGGELRRELKL